MDVKGGDAWRKGAVVRVVEAVGPKYVEMLETEMRRRVLNSGGLTADREMKQYTRRCTWDQFEKWLVGAKRCQ